MSSKRKNKRVEKKLQKTIYERSDTNEEMKKTRGERIRILNTLNSSLESVESDADSKKFEVVELPHKIRFRKMDEAKSGLQGKDIMKPESISDVVDNHPKWIIAASGPTTSTNTPVKSTGDISDRKNSSKKTSVQLTLTPSQTTTFSPLAFLARVSRLLERGWVLKTLVERFSTRFAELRKLNNLAFFSSKTCEDFSAMIRAQRSQSSSNRWMSWGIGSNGKYLTANVSEFHKIGKGSSLSDILEERVDKKYFLSQRLVKTLVKHRKRHKEKGQGFGMNIIAFQEASESEEVGERRTS
jgi:hypothetical protein